MRGTPRLTRASLLVVALSGTGTVAVAQQPERGAWIVTLGNDTVSIERYERTAQRLAGTLMLRAPSTTLLDYELTFDAQGQVSAARLQTLRPDGTPITPARTWNLRFGADTLVAVRGVGDSITETRAAVRLGATPLWHVSHQHLAWALAVEAAVRRGGDSVPVQTWSPGGRAAYQTFALRERPGRYRVGYVGGARLIVHVNPAGRVDSVDFGETTMRVMGRRVADLDLVRVAQGFAARESSGDRLGALSPRDSTRFEAAGAALTVYYGRPAARGRALFGAMLPYGTPWRFGADAATALTLTRAIEVAGVRLPAGQYTLFLTPREDGATLHVNEQTRQWGTAHDLARDIRHYPMTRETLRTPVERFTLSVTPRDGGGVLHADWGPTRYSMPFRFLP